MKKFFYCLILLGVTSCGLIRKPKICDCCETTYISFKDVINCINKKAFSDTGYDPRLFLFHFVDGNIKLKQNLGWKLLEDSELIKIAKRNYLLIILDKNNFNIPGNLDKTKLTKVIKNNENREFFVISDSNLNIWSTWSMKDKKETIIEKLGVGNGP